MIKELFSILDSGGVRALAAAILGALPLKIIEAIFAWRTAEDKAKAEATAADKESIRADSQSYIQNLRSDNTELRGMVRLAQVEAREWRDKYYEALQSLYESKYSEEDTIEVKDHPPNDETPTDPGN